MFGRTTSTLYQSCVMLHNNVACELQYALHCRLYKSPKLTVVGCLTIYKRHISFLSILHVHELSFYQWNYLWNVLPMCRVWSVYINKADKIKILFRLVSPQYFVASHLYTRWAGLWEGEGGEWWRGLNYG